jgi:hypothetical protein
MPFRTLMQDNKPWLIAGIRTNNGPGGKRNNFEDAASYLLPYNLVAKKHVASKSKQNATYISGVEQDDDADVSRPILARQVFIYGITKRKSIES